MQNTHFYFLKEVVADSATLAVKSPILEDKLPTSRRENVQDNMLTYMILENYLRCKSHM